MKHSDTDWENCLRTAHKAADEMCKATMGAFRKRPKITVKGDQSPVTAADKAAEKIARKVIGSRHPDHGFFGEEFGRDRGRKFLWVVDPIDGTRSFATGCPTFGTLIALAEDDEPHVGLIDIPAMGERWFARKGGPALYREGRAAAQRVRCSQVKRLKDASVAATSVLSGPRTVHPGCARVLYSGKTHRIGGDSINYALLASGQLDVVIDVDNRPYDFMAMVPVITAAGGCISDWKGNPLTTNSGDKVVASATPELHEEALLAISGKIPSKRT